MLRKKLHAAPPKPPRLTQVAAYARVSCDKDAMLESLSAQVSHYSAMIQVHPGWQFAGVYADEALTGTKDNRPEFQRLLVDCRAGKIDLILVKALSRLARNTVTLLETVRELKALGVDIYFERENIHTMSAEGELLLTLIAAVAQDESRSVSENCRWRIRNGFREGKVWPVKPYGYCIVDGEYVIVEHEAATVRMIFADYVSGMGINAIMRKLNNLGIPFGIEPRWNESTIHKMLRNERYAGDMLLQKTFVVDHLTKRKQVNRGELPATYVEGNHEPIIDPEMFRVVQRRLSERSALYAHEYKGHGLYPFTGLLHCANCGKPFRRKVNAAGTKYAKPVWICRTYNQLGRAYCASKQIPEVILHEVVASVLGNAGADHSGLAGLITGIDVHNGNLLHIHLADGRVEERVWADRSRSDGWDEANREQARQHAHKRWTK